MKALIVVDVQNDFFEGGALQVSDSNSIIPVINSLLTQFDKVFFTQDWHPEQHKSFAAQHPGRGVYDVVDLHGLAQVLWPVHCVQGTEGAEFKAEIAFRSDKHVVVHKGTHEFIDSYSGFFDNGKKKSTELHQLLTDNRVTEVYICGLAADYCVKYTAIDAVNLGYKTHLIQDATRAVNLNSNDFNLALAEMQAVGIDLINASSIALT